MDLSLQSVRSPRELRQFVTLPWQIYRADPCWVPPLIEEQIDRLTPGRNPFWKNAGRELWIARRGKRAVGRIAAIIDHNANRQFHTTGGRFGFFECEQDGEAAARLFSAAEAWLRERGATYLEGPYNPTHSDENGILIEGFSTRPALLEAHNPPYYAGLVEQAGYCPHTDLVARLYCRQPGLDFEQLMPPKILRAAERACQRADLSVRPVDLARWPQEIRAVWQIYNTALSTLGDYLPVPEEEFRRFADSFKPFIDPAMALIAEIDARPVGFSLALPDIYEALQHVNGRLDLPGLAKLWWYSRRIRRVSFKILMVLPEFHYRGVEALLLYETARGIYHGAYREVDMSMTGDNNPKSNRLQENLGFQVYRRYRIYRKELN